MFTIHTIGCHFVNAAPFSINRPEGTGDYLLIFLRTNAEIWEQGFYRPVPASSFYLFPIDAPQIYRKLDEPFVNDWMHFSIDEDTNYFQKLQLPFCTPIQLEDHSIINNMMLELLTEIFSPGGRKAATIDAMTNAMFHKFSELYLAQKNNTDSTNHYRQMLAGLRKQLLSFSSVSVSTEQIAQDMHISRSYLEHMYKRFFGVTMQQDMITGRISYAGQLLRTTNYTISRVATVCGYDNLEHFSRQFKKVMKCSPRQYRQQAYK